jgi:hypothetical protein
MTSVQTRAKAEKERRERRKATLGTLARDLDFSGWVEEAFGARLSAGIRKMVRSVAQNRVTIVLSANSTGKTHGAARLALAWWKIYASRQDTEHVEVYTAAAPPEKNLKDGLWSEINTATGKEAPHLFAEDDTKQMHAESAPKEYVTGVTIPKTGTQKDKEARFSGKHADAMLFVVDEADAVPQPVYDGIESCMSGGSDARLLCLLNPREKRGWVYQRVRNGDANVIRLSALRHENVVQGEQVIPGAVTRETVVRRIAEWSRPVAEGEDTTGKVTFEVPEHLVGGTAEKDDGTETEPLKPGVRVVTDGRLCHMVLGVYPPAGSDQLISEEWVTKAQQRWRRYVAEHGETPTGGRIGYDVASEGADRNAVCHRAGDFVRKFGPDHTWNDVDSSKGAENVNNLLARLAPTHAFVDVTGVGDGVPRQLDVEATGVQFGESALKPDESERVDAHCHRMRDYLYWAVREWLRTEGAMLPPDDELAEELIVLTYERDDLQGIQVIKKKAMKKALDRSPDKLDSLALTFAPQGGASWDSFPSVSANVN